MAFNFSGMMQGLGQGLMNSSVLMNEQAKRDWEQQQLMLRLDREEHIEKLKMKAASEENILNRQHAETLQKQGFTHTENQTEMQMKQQEYLANRAYELDMQRLKGEQAERSAASAFRSQQAARETELYNMKIQEYKDKNKAIEETSKSLYPDSPEKQKIWSGIQKGYIQATGKANIGQEVVTKSLTIASDMVDKLGDDERVIKKEAEGLGVPTKNRSITSIKTDLVKVLTVTLAESGTDSGTGVLNLPGDSTNVAPIGERVNSDTLINNIKSAPDKDSAAAALAEAQAKVNAAMSVPGADTKKLQALASDIKRAYDSKVKTVTYTHTPFTANDEWSNPTSNYK